MKLAVLITFLMGTMMAQNSTFPAPDQIFLNGNIWTGVRNGEGIQRAQAFAVMADRIVAVGTNDEIRKLKKDKTKVVDLGGKFVMPGFNDAHLHLSGGGFEKMNVDLVGTKSLTEMKQRIAERAKATPPGEWVLGRGWDQTKWVEQVLPTRGDMDAAGDGHPAFFNRVDGHIAVASSSALKAAGIDRNTKNPPGGEIDRDKNGEPTGILRESAMELVMKVIPPPTPAQVRKAMELALKDAAQWGLTSVQSQMLDNKEWDDFLVCEELEEEGKLTARVTMWLPFDAPLADLQRWRAHHPATDPMLHTGMLKAYMDGSLGSRTSAMRSSFSDDPGNTGLAQWDQQKLNQMAIERVMAGFQLGFHAIGDRGADMALNAFDAAQSYAREHNAAGAKLDFRNRIEHDQVIEPDQFAKYKQLGVIASVQPNHLLTDMNWAQSRLGPERAKWSYPWREFLKNGIVLAFGTDYPVEPLTPFRGVYSAVTRKNEAGSREYFPEQKLTIDEALQAYTNAAAYAEFAEKEKGTLANGMLADFVVLDRDLTKVPPSEILGTKVLKTVVGGKTVYRAE
jgi:predicted amidohydrolase YtcJ